METDELATKVAKYLWDKKGTVHDIEFFGTDMTGPVSYTHLTLPTKA